MTVAMLVGMCNNVKVSTRVFIEDAVGQILHDASAVKIKPEIQRREVQAFTLDEGTLYITVFFS